MRNTPLKAFTKKGKSPLPQTFVQPDLSFLNNQDVSDSDTAINKSLDSNERARQNIDDKIVVKKSKIKPGYENLYDEQGNFKEIDPGRITNTKEERMIEKHREANPLYNAVKGVKNVYDKFSG